MEDNQREKNLVRQTKVINLFGGPGLGKSTTAFGLFYFMKSRGIEVEAVTEYAKEIVWDKNQTKMEDQLYITAKQNRRCWRLQNQVEWIVSDSPLLLGIHYAPPEYFPHFYKKFLFELWEHYENVNFLIERTVPYDEKGRNQDEAEAKIIDKNIVEMLDKNNIECTTVPGPRYRGDSITVDLIMQKLF